jgi:SAM-dependent methyltransferase
VRQLEPPAPGVDPWQAGDAYERYMGRWSRRLATPFLRGLGVPAGRRWLDVGCGTGALCEAILACCGPSSVVGVDPSDGFLRTARARLGDSVAWHQASATGMPLSDAAVDCTVSSLVLNFVPEVDAALREMQRVTAPGGLVAVSVWDYAGRMDMIRHYWDAVARLQLLAPGQDEGERFPLCRRDALGAALSSAGLSSVEVTSIDLPLRFEDFDDYWHPFLGGQGPAPAHAMSLDSSSRSRVEAFLHEHVPAGRDGSIQMTARAWVAKGLVAA